MPKLSSSSGQPACRPTLRRRLRAAAWPGLPSDMWPRPRALGADRSLGKQPPVANLIQEWELAAPLSLLSSTRRWATKARARRTTRPRAPVQSRTDQFVGWCALSPPGNDARGSRSSVAASLDLWRAVEVEHVALDHGVVEMVAEQAVLEPAGSKIQLLVPDDVARLGLHWLLFTPFRYPPPRAARAFAARTIRRVLRRRAAAHRVRRSGLLAMARPARLAGPQGDACAGRRRCSGACVRQRDRPARSAFRS